jgi:hypothetical protein
MKINDITGKIGDLYPAREEAEVPMYSYSRPAYLFWQGFYEALRKRGLTDDQALTEMQSKGARWLLDSDGEEIIKLGRSLGKTYQLYANS